MLFLRARWYAPGSGTFLSRDPWEGDEFRPISLNGWIYGEDNPIRYTDPSGHCIFAPPYDTAACLLLLIALSTSSCGTPEPLLLDVHATIFNGSGYSEADIDAHVQQANEVFPKAGIVVRKATVTEVKFEITRDIIGDNDVVDDYFWSTSAGGKPISDPDQAPILEVETILSTNPSKGDGIIVHFVPGALSGSSGVAYPTRDAILLFAGNDGRTFPHELGHMLMAHADPVENHHARANPERNNLMTQSNIGNGLDLADWQIEWMRTSPYLKEQ